MSNGIIVSGSDDDIDAPINVSFREAAKSLKERAAIDREKKISALKLYGSELWYKGKRHDVFVSRCQIRCRGERELAKFLKSQALQDEPK